MVYATLPLAAMVWAARGAWRGVRRWPRAVAMVALILLPGVMVLYWLFLSTGSAPAPATVQVVPGMSFAAFVAQLESKGITGHGKVLRAAARLSGVDEKLHVGLYEVSPHDSPWEILGKISRHEQVYLQFTIVEGCTLKECLPEVARAVDVPVDSLWRQLRPPAWTATHALSREPAEGYLFPETYKVPWGSHPADVIGAMTKQMATVWAQESKSYPGPLTQHQAITLASLIEAEAKEGGERARISSVFHNRLKQGMRLQCDPTVIYAMGGLDRPLLRKDWEFPSPYNTYVVAGLPPGPICSPGRASLHAALYPDTADYLYFMARGDGTHIFTKTLREHEAAYREVKRTSPHK